VPFSVKHCLACHLAKAGHVVGEKALQDVLGRGDGEGQAAVEVGMLKEIVSCCGSAIG
jgi:hypothetical protein